MHEQDVKRMTGDDRNETSPEQETKAEELNTDRENDVDQTSTAKRRLPDLSEEDLLIIGLMILILSGSSPQAADGGSKSPDNSSESRKSDESSEETEDQTESIYGETSEAAPNEPSQNSGDDILIPLLLTLLIL